MAKPQNNIAHDSEQPDRLPSKDIVVWTSHAGKTVKVTGTEYQHRRYEVGGDWCDPIGAAYTWWKKANPHMRAVLMLETAIDLAMQGYDLAATLREFDKVDCFHDLGKQSVPMCRALTSALLGKCLEPNTMTFEELLVAYAPKEGVA